MNIVVTCSHVKSAMRIHVHVTDGKGRIFHIKFHLKLEDGLEVGFESRKGEVI